MQKRTQSVTIYSYAMQQFPHDILPYNGSRMAPKVYQALRRKFQGRQNSPNQTNHSNG